MTICSARRQRLPKRGTNWGCNVAADAAPSAVDPLERVRRICLGFPEAVEAGGVGDPTFRVLDKIFAMQHAVKGRRSLWCKAPRGLQQVLTEADPDRYFAPPYVGQHGWVGLYLDMDLDWDLIEGLLEDSYRLTAPKRLATLLVEG